MYWKRWTAVAVATAAASAWSAAAALAAEPVADVPAGATAGPGVSAMLANTRACTHYVSPGGSNVAAGTSPSTAWKSLAFAVPQLRAGNTLCVASGTYLEPRIAARATGEEAAPITVRALPGATSPPLIQAATDDPLFDLQADSGRRLGYWVLDGLEIDKQRHDGSSVRIEGDRGAASDATLVHHVVIRNMTIRNGKAGAAVLVRNRVTDVLIAGNEISDHRRFEWWQNYRKTGAKLLRVDYTDDTTIPTESGDDRYGRADAHGVSIEGDSRFLDGPSVERVRIEGNRLLRNGGDGVQCIGANDGDALDHASDAADVDLVDNRYEANREEGVDIKSCQRVSIRGSVSPAQPGAGTANSKFLNSRPTDRDRDLRLSPTNGNFGGGGLIVLHWNARRVLIENSRIFNACAGISVGRAEVPVRNLVIRRVLFFDLKPRSTPECSAYGSQAATAIRLDRVEHADVYHTTMDLSPSEGTGLVVGAALSPQSGIPAPYLADIDFWNNIVVAKVLAKAMLRTDVTTWTSGFRSEHNVLSSPSSTPFWLRDGGPTLDAVSLTRWRAVPLDVSSVGASPQFVADPAQNDYFTQPDSPARDMAAPVPGYGVPACSGTSPNPPDIGFRETCSAAAGGQTVVFTSDARARRALLDASGRRRADAAGDYSQRLERQPLVQS